MECLSMRTRLSLALLVVSLAACTSERPPAEPGATAPPPPSQGTAPTPPAAVTDAPAPAPAEPTMPPPAADPGDPQARFDGYGDLRLGMAAADMEKAWGGELKRLGGAQDPCYFMTPKWVKAPAEFAFMIEDGKFVRYSSERARTSTSTAPTICGSRMAAEATACWCSKPIRPAG